MSDDPVLPSSSRSFREFAEQVQRDGDLPSREVAGDLVRATAHALGAQVSRGQAEKLGPTLPDELVSALLDQNSAQARSVDETTFLDQVSTAIGSGDLDTVRSQVRVVCHTLADWAPPGEIDTMTSQLPGDVAALFR